MLVPNGPGTGHSNPPAQGLHHPPLPPPTSPACGVLPVEPGLPPRSAGPLPRRPCPRAGRGEGEGRPPQLPPQLPPLLPLLLLVPSGAPRQPALLLPHLGEDGGQRGGQRGRLRYEPGAAPVTTPQNSFTLSSSVSPCSSSKSSCSS